MEIKSFGPFDTRQVMNYLPHRYPFLFVDKILELTVPLDPAGKYIQLGTRVVGIKNATINEPYFVGHFPALPITPGVVMVEACAQVSSFGMLPWLKVDEDMRLLSKSELRLVGVDKARFRRPFMPGDILKITAELTKHRGPIWGFRCIGEIEGQLAVECEVMASVHFAD